MKRHIPAFFHYAAIAFTCAASVHTAFSQDLRERNYYYEVLTPQHAAKPQVNGFAKTRVREKLDRGLHVVAGNRKELYLSWRLLQDDAPDAAFHVYRIYNGKTERLTDTPVTATTDFTDKRPVLGEARYYVERIGKDGVSEKSEIVSADRKTLVKNGGYHSIPLHTSDRPGKVGVADLNGDGRYDYIVRTPSSNVDPGMPGNLDGLTYKLSGYLSDGTYLWTVDLGQGIEPGIWYSPYIVFDFDGDGKAEVALKTTADNVSRDEKGRVGSGEEFLTILDGMTGAVKASMPWPERNDRYGNLNRQNRNQIGMAYLDGKTPYILACRGTYKLMTVDAWSFDGKTLDRAWRWDGDEENPVIRSQGAHTLLSYDVDNDGRDEVLLGSCVIDDNGTLLWSAGLGHPDNMYLADIDPSREGLELFLVSEPFNYEGYGVMVCDARTGAKLWGIGDTTYHIGAGMVADIDPDYPGMECFAAEEKKGGSTDRYLLTSQGKKIRKNENIPDCRNWVWWTADRLRETISRSTVSKADSRNLAVKRWKQNEQVGLLEGEVLMVADLSGDWREEIVTGLPGELRIYATDIPATDRRVTLMQDALYRSYVAERSMGYPQSPIPSYYLGE